MRIARRHGGGILACCAALLAALAPSVSAAARPGALDRSFNGDGKVVTVLPAEERVRRYPNYALPFEFAPGRVAMAGMPNGKLVIANGHVIVRYLANGRRDPRFGGGGAVPIEGIDGFRFQLADVAIDSKGRVLVAGTTKATNGIGLEAQATPGPLPSIGTIRRFNANGTPDTSFGSGGVLHSWFGAPPATFEGRPYEEATVSVIGLAVDAEDRPIVSGSAVARVGRCGGTEERYELSQAFVSRSAVGGGPDPGFAGGGSLVITDLAWLGLPAASAGGIFAAGTAQEPPCRSGGGPGQASVVAGIGDSSLIQGFGGNGVWSRPFTRVSDLAIAPGGKIVLLTRKVELRRGKWVEGAGRAIRLRPNGTFDRRFGRKGVATVRLPRRAAIRAIAVDAKGRVLLAGTVKRKPRRVRRANLRILLIRTTAAGRVDRRFGRGGRVATNFGARANVRTGAVVVDRAGRIAVGGKIARPAGGNAFAIARYRGGR